MVQSLMPFEQIGTKREGVHGGGKRQKYILDEPGRRLLLARYDGSSECVDELEQRLRVPRWKINRWAGELGLARQREPRWTPEDETYLMRNLHSVSLSDIAQKLGRTKVAVRLKAKRLQINKCEQEGYSMRGLEMAIGADHKRIKRWVEAGWLKGTRRGTERVAQQGGDVWYFSDEAIRKFIIAHPNEVDPRRADWLWLVDILAGGYYGLGSLV